MNNHDFLTLSPPEFELFIKDLLESHLKVHIEAFADGVDGGIDLRFKDKKGGTVIIQCKRFKNITATITSMNKEVGRISRIAPARYIVATAIDMSDKSKQRLVNMFASVGLKEQDIMGRKDLNKILFRHREVEDRFFKLWISSTNVLNRIFKARVYNYSEFKKKQIKDLSKFYVSNDSLHDALEILKKHRYCIISGIPGIGKSTLTKILACHLLARGYKELFYLTKTFSDGIGLIKAGKKQVFIFDDFLGRLVSENKLEFNEDAALIDFIEMVKQSPNCLLILATRENILNLGKIQYEALNDERIQLTKCIIDLSKYTQKVRALILSNHLFYSGMDQAYIDALLKNRFYFKLLEHRNYSPRIIDELTIKKAWIRVRPAGIQELFSQSFNNPYFVWKDAFDRQLKPISRCILILMASCGDNILEEDIRKLLQHFLRLHGTNYDASYSHKRFDNALIELHDCFITTLVDTKGAMGLRFQNPSIQDFLMNHIASDERIISDIISSAVYLNQVTCFACRKIPSSVQNSIVLNWLPDPNRYLSVESAIISRFNDLLYYEVSNYTTESLGKQWYYPARDIYEILDTLDTLVHEIPSQSKKLKDFILTQLQQSLSSLGPDSQFRQVSAVVKLLQRYIQGLIINEGFVMETLLRSSVFLHDLKSILLLKDVLPQAFTVLKNDRDRLIYFFEKTFEYELAFTQKHGWSNLVLVDNVKEIAKVFKLNLQKYWMRVPKDIPPAHLKKRLDSISVGIAETKPANNPATERDEINLIFERLVSSSNVLGTTKVEEYPF